MKWNLFYAVVVSLCMFACSNNHSKLEQGGSQKETCIEDSVQKSYLYLAESKYNFGDVNNTQELQHTFEIINKGHSPLVINKADVSCGCVKVEFDEKPIMPSKKGYIKVHLNPKNQKGKLNKRIFIDSNAENNIEVLYITANVKF